MAWEAATYLMVMNFFSKILHAKSKLAYKFRNFWSIETNVMNYKKLLFNNWSKIFYC
jgi:hypothetical protein